MSNFFRTLKQLISPGGIEGIMLFEPNEGYEWDGILEIGDFGYVPKYVLV